MKTVIVAYIPAIHSSYLAWFKKYNNAQLYILGDWIKEEFPVLEREIRAVKPDEVKNLLSNSFFTEIHVATQDDLCNLASRNDRTIILSYESVSDYLAKNYFSKSKIKRDQIFLRFDEKQVKQSVGEANYTTKVTRKKLHRDIMKLTEQQTKRCAIWWRQVGAALVRDNGLILATTNNAYPIEQEQWIIGDPRMYVPYGTDTHRRNVIHAEQSLIAQAARRGIITQGLSLYTTTFPCPDCAMNVIEAGITRVYFQKGFADLGSDELLKNAGVELIRVV